MQKKIKKKESKKDLILKNPLPGQPHLGNGLGSVTQSPPLSKETIFRGNKPENVIMEEDIEHKDDQSEINKLELDRDIADFLMESKMELKRQPIKVPNNKIIRDKRSSIVSPKSP